MIIDTKWKKFHDSLLDEYKGKKLQNVIEGYEYFVEEGVCYCIQYKEEFELYQTSQKVANKAIISELKLINGIGEFTEKKLREEGYNTIEDLTKHPQFCSSAKEFMEIFNSLNIRRISDLIKKDATYLRG